MDGDCWKTWKGGGHADLGVELGLEKDRWMSMADRGYRRHLELEGRTCWDNEVPLALASYTEASRVAACYMQVCRGRDCLGIAARSDSSCPGSTTEEGFLKETEREDHAGWDIVGEVAQLWQGDTQGAE